MILFGWTGISAYIYMSMPESIIVERGGELPDETGSWVLTNGLLLPKTAAELSDAEAVRHFEDNLWTTIKVCEHALSLGASRICVIGSSSAWRGSYNMLYAALKAGLHGYVRGRRLRPGQQLVCLAPGVIEDAGMTIRRTEDEVILDDRRMQHPQLRFTTCKEVAQVAVSLLRGPIHINNTIIDMSGGER